MFTFRIEGAYDAAQLLDAHKWPTRAVTVIQPGAAEDWFERGPHHKVVFMSDVNSVKMSQTPPTVQQVQDILEFTEGMSDNDQFLVNCWLGQSRSSAIMLGVLIQYGYEPQEALDMVIEQRPVAMPNLLICQHIDTIYGLNGETHRVAADYVKAELRKVGLAPSKKPSTAAVGQMNDLLKLFQ